MRVVGTVPLPQPDDAPGVEHHGLLFLGLSQEEVELRNGDVNVRSKEEFVLEMRATERIVADRKLSVVAPPSS